MKLTVCVLLLVFAIVSDAARTRKRRPKHKSKSRSEPIRNDGQVYETDVHNAEFMVGVIKLFDQYPVLMCAATIIHIRWAISSRNCGFKYIGFRTEAQFTTEELMLGKVIARSGTQWIEGSGGFDHRIVELTHQLSLTFIKVKEEFTNYPYDTPVHYIASYHYNFSIPLQGQLIGWGDSVFPESALGTLKSAEVKIISHEECTKYYPEASYLSQLFCVTYVKGVVCDGVGGDPLIRDNVLLGIVWNYEYICDATRPVLLFKVGDFGGLIKIYLGRDGDELHYFPPL